MEPEQLEQPASPAPDAEPSPLVVGEPSSRPSSRKAAWLAMGAVALALGLIWLAPGVGHVDESSPTAEIPGDPDDALATGKMAPMHFTLQDMNGAYLV